MTTCEKFNATPLQTIAVMALEMEEYFDKTSLTDSPLHSSVPLVIPNDMQYDYSSNTLRKTPG